MSHRHRCTRCRHVWECFENKPKEKCPITKAAKTNGQGPHCGLCCHLIMATRYARASEREPVAQQLRVILKALRCP